MANKMIEKWEYLTDIITSYDGHEQRLSIRQYPRHIVSYDYPSMDCFEAQWLRGLGRMRQTDAYYIPMWHNVVRLRESHVGGKALYIEPSCMYGLDDVEWIEIFKHDNVNQRDVNIVRRVHSYSDGFIALRDAIREPLDMRNTWIYPLKQCARQKLSGLNYIYSNGSNVMYTFEDLLKKPATVSIPYKYISEYEDYPQRNRWKLPEMIDDKWVFSISPQWIDDSSVTLSIEKNLNELDNQTGIFLYDLKNVKSYDIHTLDLYLMYKAEINNVIRFFKRVKGRYKSFYAPTWVNDFQIARDIHADDNFIYTDWEKISDFYSSNKRQKKLVVFTKDWKSYIFDIMSYSYETFASGKKFGKMYFTQPTGVDISLDNILMASYLNLVRLDSDTLQLDYETDTVAHTTLVLKEVDDT